jgi:hypothetical protein
MHPGEGYDDEDIRRRYSRSYGEHADNGLTDEQIGSFRRKWESISEYVKEIKQGFSRFYNKLHDRKGTFWSERFKSVLVEDGETLVNCLAYVDLNPVRAGIVEKPEGYRWCSLGYHVQRNNAGKFLSMDFGLREFGLKGYRERLAHYRRFVYEKGGLLAEEGDRMAGLPVSGVDRFRYRTRYFADSGIIGTKAFVMRYYQRFKGRFFTKREKRPVAVAGLDGVFSLKRVSDG